MRAPHVYYMATPCHTTESVCKYSSETWQT